MSGIYAALFPQPRTSWVTQLEQLAKRLEDYGEDGMRTVALYGYRFSELRNNRLYTQKHDGGKYGEYLGLLGCAYNYPLSLPAPDAGPFFNRQVAVAYDGVVAKYSGEQLCELSAAALLHWSEFSRTLDGQFAILAVYPEAPRRIYYATRAKPLFVLFDSMSRGIIVCSAKEALGGMYHPVRNPQPVMLSPYTCGYVELEGSISELGTLVRLSGDGSLVLSGGGLDTLVAANAIKSTYPDQRMTLVYFNYGAKASEQERIATYGIASSLNIRYPESVTDARYYNLSTLVEIAASSLTDDKLSVNANPQAGNASEWFPARNTVLMSLGLAMAESHGFARIVTGINADAATAYSDNDRGWNERIQDLVPYALGGGRHVDISAPLGRLNKAQIVRLGSELGISWKQEPSWSCYNGNEVHCAECSSCRARRKAFELAGIKDPTKYAE